jgi:HK97 gp10 family phage protein
MATELRGFDDLQDDLLNMAAALENGPGVNRALKAGAAPIEQQMLHNASTDPKIITGELFGSIRTGNVKGGKRGKRITIGVHHKDNAAYFSNPLEFGHGGPAPAPAHPFVRSAFDVKSDEAYEEIKRVLRDELNN